MIVVPARKPRSALGPQLKRSVPVEKNVQEKRQPAMATHPPVVCDGPEVALFYWKLEDERVICHLYLSAWRFIGGGKICTPDLLSAKNRGLENR